MSWLQKLLPPKIQRTGGTTRKTVPEGLWTKCPACDAVLYATDLEKNLNVCPKCGHVLWVTPKATAKCGACPNKGRDAAPSYVEENE